MKDKKERMNRRTIITAIVVTLMSVSNVVRAIDAEREIKYCERQTEKALQALQPYDFSMMPRNILQGQTQWNLRKAIPEEWCSGFWTGILWMDYAHSRNEAVKRAAEQYTDAIEPIVAKPVYDHDLGFIVINSLLTYSIVYNTNVDMMLAERVVKRAVKIDNKPLTVDDILEKVCNHYHVQQQNVFSKSRKRDYVMVRQISMYFAQKYTKMPASRIGQLIGGRDHSTVIHSCSTVEQRLKVDKAFSAELSSIENSFKLKK